MLIKLIKDVSGNPINRPPEYVKPDEGSRLVALGLAIQVATNSNPVLGHPSGELSRACTEPNTIGPDGQVRYGARPAPDGRWTIIPEERKSADWVEPPHLYFYCKSCGRRDVLSGPKAHTHEVRHCQVVTEPRVGNYVRVTVDRCPEPIVAEYKRLYELWARDNRARRGSPVDVYAAFWAKQQVDRDSAEMARQKRLPRLPRKDNEILKPDLP